MLDVVGDGLRPRRPARRWPPSWAWPTSCTSTDACRTTTVDDFYAAADVFVFPSYREAGGIVVVEAISHGLPAIVCATGGPATSVDDTSGIRIAALDPAQYAQGLARAMLTLAQDPALRLRLGRGARERAASVSLWPRRIEAMEALYDDAAAAG